MANAFFFLFNFLVGILLALGVQRWDRRRLLPEQRAWVWNAASWGSAVYNFGPLSLVAWGYVTRSPRYVVGLLIGVELATGALLVQGALNEAVGRLLGFGPEKLDLHRVQMVASIAVCAALAILVGLGRSIYEAVRRRLRGADASARG